MHVQVTASSPSCRSTDPKAVVSGNFLRNNAASQQRDGGTWWRMDLGAHHRLMCNYYTMRHDASPDYPRSWALQVPFLLHSRRPRFPYIPKSHTGRCRAK